MKLILAERLMLQRKRAGLSLQEVKNSTGMAVSTISSYERGTTVPSAPQLIKLAGCYGVSTDYLLGLKTQPLDMIKTDGLDEVEIALVAEFVQVLLRAKGQSHSMKMMPSTDHENASCDKDLAVDGVAMEYQP